MKTDQIPDIRTLLTLIPDEISKTLSSVENKVAVDYLNDLPMDQFIALAKVIDLTVFLLNTKEIDINALEKLNDIMELPMTFWDNIFGDGLNKESILNKLKTWKG
jgi:hypothetical protein